MTSRSRRLAAARTGAEDRLAALRIRQLAITERLAGNERQQAAEEAAPAAAGTEDVTFPADKAPCAGLDTWEW